MIPHSHARVREISRGPFRGMVIVDSMIDQYLQNDGNPDDLFQVNVRPLKSSGSTYSALVEVNASRPEGNLEKLFVKEFRFKGAIHSLKPLFCKHRAQVMWQVSWHLLNWNISVPEPQGYLIKQKGPFCLRGYFFSEVLPKCSSLEELTRDLKQLNKRFDSEGLIGFLARKVAALHDSGATHGDLKWSNILVHEEKNKLWFVDLDAAKLHGQPPSSRAVARDLARFLLSGLEAGIDEKTLDKFLDYYARQRKLTRKSFDKPVTSILEKLKNRHEKKRQNMLKE